MIFNNYDHNLTYDEMFDEKGLVRSHYQKTYELLQQMVLNDLNEKQKSILTEMIQQGITFTLYGNNTLSTLERTIPFDIIPRIIPKNDWSILEKGLKQRVKALNRFIYDVYHEQAIFQAGIIPRKIIINNCYFRYEMMHLDIPGDVYISFSGIDIVRAKDGSYYVLEDNLRTPSGISYVYKNRWLMQQFFPEITLEQNIEGLEYGLNHFLASLRSIAPYEKPDPTVVLLTPGCYNSAYYEHTFLAQEMGIELAEGQDLKVIHQKVYLKNINGLKQVDVIYRRLDDDFLDPVTFRDDSLLGVPGLMSAYRAGNVAIANAPGTGFADDKSIYTYVPEIIRFYLNEEPILKNVPTYVLSNPESLQFVLENLNNMVVKETSLSGGYGMLIGPHASKEELLTFKDKILKEPQRYIAQPTLMLSTVPSLSETCIAARHVDLRPYVVMGRNENINIIPGGLTRVALSQGSLVVNSSQGGGTKDTWII